MDSEKFLDVAVKGSSMLNSLRKINKAVSTYRFVSYIVFGCILMFNIFGIINTLKQ